MVIDSHEHIMFPIKMQLDKMDAAGVDKTILFCTAPHQCPINPVFKPLFGYHYLKVRT